MQLRLNPKDLLPGLEVGLQGVQLGLHRKDLLPGGLRRLLGPLGLQLLYLSLEKQISLDPDHLYIQRLPSLP